MQQNNRTLADGAGVVVPEKGIQLFCSEACCPDGL